MYILSSLVHLLGVSILSHLLSRRLSGNFSPRQLPWPRICILIIFMDSYLFLFTAGVLILGVHIDGHLGTCSWTPYLCVFFYGSSKVFVYWFLTERVHIVWRPFPTAKRSQSTVYIICLLVGLVGYCGILGYCFSIATHILSDVGVCRIVLRSPGAFVVLSFDVFINILLTGLFVWPLLRFRFRDARLKSLGARTLCAALVALTTSCGNLLILALMDGNQLGWVCLGSCGLDVVINAIVLFWVTGPASDPHDGPTVTTPRTLRFNVPTEDAQPPSCASVHTADTKIENVDLEGGKTLSRDASRASPSPGDERSMRQHTYRSESRKN